MSGIIEAKIIFTGPPGAGKTTAISMISEIPVITTEAMASDETALQKETTTVGMDYGELQIDESLVLRLYGTPGQRRFSHMWRVLAQGALGFLILVDNARPWPLSDLGIYLDNFKSYIDESAAVIVVTRTDVSRQPELEAYHRFLNDRDEFYPVVTADVRQRGDVLEVLEILLTNLEIE
jgi:signal recognition particle receptor subunit beta